MKLLRFFFKLIRFLLSIVVVGIVILMVVFLSKPLWRYSVTYPRLERDVVRVQQLRKEQPSPLKLKTYRGVLHGHSYWSHDSKGTVRELVSAAKKTGTGFIFLSDHPHGNLDTLPRGIQGNYDGVLIEPGTEKNGLNVWPLQPMVIDWRSSADSVVSKIVGSGGLVVYSHPEEPHNYLNQLFQGMEIYNFHVDTEDESLYPMVLNFLVSGNKFRHWAYRELFDEQTKMIALWDSLNTHRRVTGFSAIDAHENQNFRAKILTNGRVVWYGPNAKVLSTSPLKWWHKLIFHKPDEEGYVFKWMVDTYETGFDFVTNYVLADTLSTRSIADNVRKGHLYVGFKSLGDADGFLFSTVDQKDSITGIMGDSVKIEQVHAFKTVSPLPGRIRMFQNGKLLKVSEGDVYELTSGKLPGKGSYRVDIQLKIRGEYVPWVYSNPIYLY